MNEKKTSSYRWFFWFSLAVGVIVLVALLTKASKVSSSPTRITISVNATGSAQLGGITLPSTNIRDAAFSALGAAGMKAKFTPPSTLTNTLQESNILSTLESMSRAGLFTTNAPRSPSPYE
jgi:hypothetical protein